MKNRASRLANLGQPLDLLIIGGGITGAGITLEAARRGLRVLLAEQRDFAWGSSSRSSKLVHGGLRYLKEGKFQLTRESVHERQQLLHDAPGLIDTQRFALGDYAGRKPGRRTLALGLTVYDWMAGEASRRYWPAEEFLLYAPHIRRAGLLGGTGYVDAKTDDARLVLRVLQEAEQHGATAINYLEAVGLLRDGPRVVGCTLRDAVSGTAYPVTAQVVINATGAWADHLRGELGAAPKLRPLRGSHLLFPLWRLPVAQAVSFMHPEDGRPVFVYPWEGAALLGTTDLDHPDVRQEAAITSEEVRYLMAGIRWQFPSLDLQEDDVLSSYAGVRPVIRSGAGTPSQEGREHIVLQEDGLVTVTGGKLTTFRVIALDCLRRIRDQLPNWTADLTPRPVFVTPAVLQAPQLSPQARQRLSGRYGEIAQHIVTDCRDGEWQGVANSEVLPAELRWALRHEQVVKLEDLMLRRTRLGLLQRNGGIALLRGLRSLIQAELGWDDARWQLEEMAYLAVIHRHYSLPGRPAAV